MAANKLEEKANEIRSKLVGLNTYNNNNAENNYSGKHKNAKSDGDPHGKGTGVYMDTENGGSSVDINGNGTNIGSGRTNLIKLNKYNKDNQYSHPDTSGNAGQVHI